MRERGRSRSIRNTFFFLFAFFFALAPRSGFSAQPSEPGNPLDTELEGDLVVLHEDRADGSRYHYFVHSDGERIALEFANEPSTDLTTGSRVRVRGRRTGQTLALGGTSASVQTLSVALPNTFGAQKTAVILVNFQDNTTQPYTWDYAKSVFATTSSFDLENSYQQTWLAGDVFGWYTLPVNSTTTDTGQIATLAQQAAAAHGVDLSAYNRFVYAFPQIFTGWWGMGTIGGNPSESWINGNLELKVLGHEMGHNLGLYHSHGLNCGTVTLGTSCSSDEYGDTIDMMGNPSAGHFHAAQKERLGWLNYGASPPIATVASDGVYSLAPYETFDPDTKALKVLQSVDPVTGGKTWYYIEYRRPLGFDSFITDQGGGSIENGVVVRLSSDFNANRMYLLDMTPTSWMGLLDPSLPVGQSYYDPNAGVTIVPLSVSSTGASVSVTFDASPPPPPPPACVQANPAIALSPSTGISLSPGAAATYMVTVTDNDSSTCSAANFNLSAAVPSGWSASLASSTLSLSPGASASTTLTVTASTTAAAGSYTITTTAANGAYTASSSASITVPTVVSLALSVSTDKPSYTRNQTVTVTATLSKNGSPVANDTVNFTIKKSNGASVAGSGMTGVNGAAVYKYRLNKKDPTGTWSALGNTSLSGAAASNSKNFTVQ